MVREKNCCPDQGRRVRGETGAGRETDQGANTRLIKTDTALCFSTFRTIFSGCFGWQIPYLIEQNGREFKHEKRLCFPGPFFAVLARNSSFPFIFLCFTWKTTSLLHRDDTFLKNNHNSQIYILQRTDTLKVGVIIKRTELPVKIRNKERQYLLWIRIYPSDISRRRGRMS